MEEDDKIRELFTGFNPGLSSDAQFMQRLRSKMESVEMIREHNVQIQRRGRKAIAVAAVAGFVVGFLFSLAMPVIGNMVANMLVSMPDSPAVGFLADNYRTMMWLLIGMTSVFTAINAYDLTFFLLAPQRKRTDGRGRPDAFVISASKFFGESGD